MALLIGTACGFFIGTLFTMLWAVNITAPGRKPSALFGSLNRVPGTIPASALLPLAVMGAWGLGGGMIGALYIGAEALAPGSGIGSPNMAFSIGICAFTLNAVVLGAFLDTQMDLAGRIHTGPGLCGDVRLVDAASVVVKVAG